MSARNAIEKRTGWEVVITYLIVIILCGALFFYMFKLRNSADNQRGNVSKHNNNLEMMSEFTHMVHEAQGAANLFAFSDQSKYFKQYEDLCVQAAVYADSIRMTSTDNDHLLQQILDLLERKGGVSKALSRYINYYNPLEEIDKTLEDISPVRESSYVISTTTKQDTVIQTATKRNFRQRLVRLFKPSAYQDSVIQIANQTIDTVKAIDSLPILSDLKTMSQKAKTEYSAKIKEYEKRSNELIMADNELSEQISLLLLTLNQEILDSTVREIENSRNAIDDDIEASVIIGAVVLVLIVIFIILIISDVNKGYRARRAAEEARRKTEEIMESRHKMLLSISHDIKTPLTSIMGNVDLMDAGCNPKEINSIRLSADHILNLLTNLLDYSSLEQGRLTVNKAQFALRKTCDEVAAMFEPIAKNKNLTFNYRFLVDPDVIINSDKLKIKQIASNLISNAIKYTIEGDVGFEVRMNEGCLCFNISDTGVGIPQEKIDEVFKPFVRIDTYNTLSEGNGYGLSVVKGLVELLDGRIEVTSEVGKGSCFTMSVPVETVLPTAGAEASRHHETYVTKNILIIDDDDTLLNVLDNMLHRIGLSSVPCRSKADLDIALADIAHFDCILTDREMGALTGNDILRCCKEAASDKPVVLMTARVEYSHEKALEEGFDGFLAKPFSLTTLSECFGVSCIQNQGNGDQFTDPFDDFKELGNMLDHDSDAIRNILSVFAQSTPDNLVALNEAVEADDFVAAQNLCHKMLPMFIQLERNDAVHFLSKMNAMRGDKKSADEYKEWKDDAAVFMKQTDTLLEMLEEKYRIE